MELLGQRFLQATSAATGPATFGALHFATVQAVIPASGVLELPLRVLALPAGEQAALHHVQARFTDTGGQATWSAVAITDALAGAAFVGDCAAAECRAPSLVHIDDDAPGDPGPGDATVSDPEEDGSAEHPFDSLLEAIVTVAEGGEILLEDGYYTGAANTDIGLLGRALTIGSVNGPASCVLDAEGDAHVLSLVEGEPEGTLVQGLTLTGASAGGAVISQSSPTIDRCWIVGNSSPSSGAGLQIGGGSPRITRCTIAGNISE